MNRIMTPGFFLLLAAAAIIMAMAYVQNYGAARNTGGIWGGFLILAAASVLAAVRLRGND